jgi:protein-S-isoprenylcysteine O-methyltransferase Ste14
MNRQFLGLSLVYLLALLGRITYDWLKLRGRANPKNRLVFAVVFVDMFLLWGSWFSLCESDPSSLGLPHWLRQFGLGLTLLGGALFLGALLQLRVLENTTHLVTTGLFRFTRHPIYTGFACWYVGWPLHWDRSSALLLGTLSLGAVIWWRRVEERALVLQFGSAYEDYRQRTWV